jgi:integrase/recombinase XerD
MALLLLDTGLRVSELVGLRVSDTHLEVECIKLLDKGSKERIVPLGQSSRRVLATYIRRHRPEPALPGIDQVFLARAGYPMKPDYVYKILARACREVGISGKRLGPHTCRHTSARSFLINGGDVLTLQRILGHSSLEVVKLYANLDMNDLLAQQRKYSPMDTLKSRHATVG